MGSILGRAAARRGCLAVGFWAVVTFMSGNLTTSDKLGVFGLWLALLPLSGAAAKMLKPSSEMDLVQTARELDEAVEKSELA
ncbi:hypothetical protein OHA84_01325 [Streptomyces sp. NBC_00513]|uniref:hypothetical protein n=1 Tax=unclassified Streptomyces TaxID=2593676 RepID=UPI002251D991|nr:hypothetical protein [Streptomyces sp. NBC_00424]MCX5079345.1 hypothetical protein [Streptomyces sp. NBC_00424]WUD39248.1 hypothetical protein OHA84_01325 [Streptomyces sp. NBC_00513]